MYARVAQLVEHDLAKVGVAGSSPVSRSTVTRKGHPVDVLFLSYRKFLDHQYVAGFSKNREAIVATESPIPFFVEAETLINTAFPYF